MKFPLSHLWNGVAGVVISFIGALWHVIWHQYWKITRIIVNNGKRAGAHFGCGAHFVQPSPTVFSYLLGFLKEIIYLRFSSFPPQNVRFYSDHSLDRKCDGF